jgi:hypothetical protein
MTLSFTTSRRFIPTLSRLDLAPPLADQFIVGVAPIDYGPIAESPRGIFTPRRSQIPDVNLSIHPARATE